VSVRGSETYQLLFFEAAEDGMLLADAQERIVDANLAACRLLGQERERLVGSALGTLFDPSYPFHRVACEVRDGETFKGSVGLMRGDGSSFPAEVSLVRGEDGTSQGLIFRGLTEGGAVEEALKEGEEQFRSLVENAQDLIGILEPDSTISYVSPALEHMTGYRPEEWIGQKFTDYVNPEDVALGLGALEEVASNPDPDDGRGPLIRIRHKDGSWRFWEGRANNLLDHPSIRGVVFNTRDVTERVLAEQALKESEERFRKLAEATFEAIAIHERGKILEVNQCFCDMFGYEAEEVIGMNALDFAAPESRDLIREKLLSGDDEPYEAVGLRKNGTLLHAELRGTTITYRGRNVRVTAVRDITERKLAEERLRQAESRYRTLVERMPAVVYIQEIGSPDSAMYMSPKIETLTGYSPEECKAPDLRWRMVHPDDHEWMRSEDERAGESGEVFTTEYRVVHRDGRTVWVHNESVMLEEEGGRRYWQGFMVDITERKKAEEALRESENRLRLAVEATELGIWDFDVAADEFRLDERCKTIFALPQEVRVSYENFIASIHPDDRGRVEELIESMPSSRDEGDFRMEYRTACLADDREQWVATRGQAFFDEEGRPVRFVGTVSDVSARKQAEQEIRRLNEKLLRRAEELSRSNVELERFAYVVSHDLQAPLRRIEGFAEALLEDYAGRLDVEGRDFLRRIVVAARRMERLVVGLLEFSRVASEEIRRERVDLSAISASVFEELRRTDPGRRVEFVVPEEAPVCGDTRLLRVMLESLLENAWTFTANRESARIEFGKNGRGESLTYYVRDNGEGFDAAQARELFRAFGGLHPGQGSDNLGLGLAKARRIVERHGGRIWAEGEPGRGAAFYFTLQGEEQ